MEPSLTKAEKKALRKEERQQWEAELDKKSRQEKLLKNSLWVIVPLLILGSVFGLYKLATMPSTSDSSTLTAPQLTTTDIATGSATAKVTLIEYADFQCPSCGLYHPVVKKLIQEEGDKLRFVYRYFPLTQIHPNAMDAARASYAALKQNKFWEMHDMLFEHQQDWAELSDATPVFDTYAKNLGLNMDQYHKDFKDSATDAFINTEEDTGTAAGVNSTPTFFVNGKSIQLPQGYDAFKKVIDEAAGAK